MVVDFLKASIKFAKLNNTPLNLDSGIFLTGYSEGGYVALAALPKLEKENFKIKQCAPIDGAYLLGPLFKRALSYRYIPFPSYLVAIIYSYSKAYNIPIKSMIKEPYSNYISNLFLGEYSKEQIDKKLTSFRDKLLTSSFRKNFTKSRLYKALLENSVIDFQSSSEIKLLHCKGDRFIPYKIALYAKRGLNILGTNSVEVIPIEEYLNLSKKYNHKECARYGYEIVAKIFNSAREESF